MTAATTAPSATESRTVPSACPVCPAETPAVDHAQGPDFEYETTGGTEWSLKRCEGCGTIFLDPRPDESELGRIYPTNYYAYDFTTKQSLGFKVKTHLDARAARGYLARCPQGTNVLDIGCGDGRLLRVFAELGVPRERLYGCDFDDAAIARGKEQGLQVSLGRFEEADLPLASFGVVILQQVIEHVPDPASVLEKIHELLVPGGVVILETPNVRSWDHALFPGRYWGGYHIPRHFFLFTADSLGALLRKTGYEVAETTPLVSPSFWVQSVHHTLKERPLLSPLRRLFHPQRPNAVALATFTGLDTLGKTLGLTSNMRVVGRKPPLAPRSDAETPVSRAEFQELGYQKAEGLFADERLAPCRERFAHLWEHERGSFSILTDEHRGHGIVKAHQLAGRDPAFTALAEDPRLRAAVEALIGPARVFRDVCLSKPPGSAHDLGYHQDAAYWDVAPERLLSAWIALDDVPPESGCLRVIPGSHHQVLQHELRLGQHRLPSVVTQTLRRAVSLTGTGDNPVTPTQRAFFRAKQLVLGPVSRALTGGQLKDLAFDPAELPGAADPVEVPARAGDVILFHGLLLHGSGPNTSANRWRRAYIVTFAGG